MPKPQDIPVCPDVPTARSSVRVVREYRIRLITPLFGGGVEAGEPDPTLPIRGTSIRGQLQFWWRATRGASCSTYDELFARHAEVWGTTDRASAVTIEVRDVEADTPRPCLTYAPRTDGKLQPNWEKPFNHSGTTLPYVLFPFQGQLAQDRRRVEKNPARFIERGSFTLHVRYHEELRQEVETAVWAWINFGGLGARTRRGCGALFCEELAPNDIGQIGEWFKAGATAGEVRSWPTLPASVLIRPEAGAPVAVWVWLIRRFRAPSQITSSELDSLWGQVVPSAGVGIQSRSQNWSLGSFKPNN